MKANIPIKTVAKWLSKAISNHSQTITGIGAVLGLGVTTWLTYNAADEIKELFKEREEDLREIQKSDASNEEVKVRTKELNREFRGKLVKKAGPVIVAFVATMALMVGTVVISNLKIQNLTSIATYSELAYQELLNKTKEEVGEEKAEEIQKEVEEKLDKESGYVSRDCVAKSGNRVLYFDAMTGNTFWLSPDELNEIIFWFNKMLDDNQTYDIPLVHFYNKIAAKGNKHMYDLPIAEGYAWRSNSVVKRTIRLNDSNAKRTPQGAAIVMDFYERPKYWEDLT